MAKRSRTNSYLNDQISDPSLPQLSKSEQSTSPPTKITVPSSNTSSESQVQHHQLMRCSLPPHKDILTFSSYDDYEAHYLKTHVNRCSECGKNFPTQHILDIHIEENHDPLILARRDRGEKTYSCFVEGCERKCSTPQKRRRHLIDKHMFPRNYNFFIVNDGIDKQNSLLLRTSQNHGHHRRLSLPPQSPLEGRLRNRKTSVSSTPVNNGQGADELFKNQSMVAGDDEVDVLTSSFSALKFVPTSVIKRLESERK